MRLRPISTLVAVLWAVPAGATTETLCRELASELRGLSAEARLRALKSLRNVCTGGEPESAVAAHAFELAAFDSEPSVSQAAFEAFLVLRGSQAASAYAPAQARRLLDASVSFLRTDSKGWPAYSAAIALAAKAGPEAVAPLARLLRDGRRMYLKGGYSPEYRDRAAKALGLLASVDAVDDLAAEVEAGPENSRRLAISALVQVGRPALPALLALLRSEYFAVRVAAVDGLGAMGGGAAAAAPELSRQLADKRLRFRTELVGSMEHYHGAVARALRAIGTREALEAASRFRPSEDAAAYRSAAPNLPDDSRDAAARRALLLRLEPRP